MKRIRTESIETRTMNSPWLALIFSYFEIIWLWIKNLFISISMDKTLQEEAFQVKFEEKKKRLRMNIIEFIIGLILLSFAFNYLKNHPAERTSMFAWIEVLFQRAEIFISNITWDNWTALKEKHQLEKYYNRLMLHFSKHHFF